MHRTNGAVISEARHLGLNTAQPVNLIRADLTLNWRDHHASATDEELAESSAPHIAYCQKLRDRAEGIDQAFPPTTD